MSRYLLDTNLCVDVIRRKSPIAMMRMKMCAPKEIALSTITLSELHLGAAKSINPAFNLSLLHNFCVPVAILPYDDSAAIAYGPIRAYLELAGTPIGPLDTLIAAHAISLNLTLITNNEREFRRIPNLKIENWTRP